MFIQRCYLEPCRLSTPGPPNFSQASTPPETRYACTGHQAASWLLIASYRLELFVRGKVFGWRVTKEDGQRNAWPVPAEKMRHLVKQAGSLKLWLKELIQSRALGWAAVPWQIPSVKDHMFNWAQLTCPSQQRAHRQFLEGTARSAAGSTDVFGEPDLAQPLTLDRCWNRLKRLRL